MAFMEDPVTRVAAEINAARQLATLATTRSRLAYEAIINGNGYVWTAQDTDVNAADTLLALRNDGNQKLVIDRIVVTGGNVASRYEAHIITATYTSAGTAVTGVNLNTGSKNIAQDVTSHADETGNTQGTVFADLAVGITTVLVFETPGLVLANGIALAVDQVTESTAGAVAFWGHFE